MKVYWHNYIIVWILQATFKYYFYPVIIAPCKASSRLFKLYSYKHTNNNLKITWWKPLLLNRFLIVDCFSIKQACFVENFTSRITEANEQLTSCRSARFLTSSAAPRHWPARPRHPGASAFVNAPQLRDAPRERKCAEYVAEEGLLAVRRCTVLVTGSADRVSPSSMGWCAGVVPNWVYKWKGRARHL